jgi:hypothetical protein
MVVYHTCGSAICSLTLCPCQSASAMQIPQGFSARLEEQTLQRAHVCCAAQRLRQGGVFKEKWEGVHQILFETISLATRINSEGGVSPRWNRQWLSRCPWKSAFCVTLQCNLCAKPWCRRSFVIALTIPPFIITHLDFVSIIVLLGLDRSNPISILTFLTCVLAIIPQ